MNSGYSNGATGAVGIGPTIAILPPLPSERTSYVDGGGGSVVAAPSSAPPRPPPTPSPIASHVNSSIHDESPSITSREYGSAHGENYGDNFVPNTAGGVRYESLGAITAPYPSPGGGGVPPSPGGVPDPQISAPRLSSTWEPDSNVAYCFACQQKFDPLFRRRHHCRLCGHVFCDDCSNTRSLIPPSALVLRSSEIPGGIGAGGRMGGPSFESNDGDASVTYVSNNASNHSNASVVAGAESDDTLLYGRGLERRILLARHPQRTCRACREQLAPLQEELCMRNSNAMRYNYVDEGDAVRRLCNSPLAFTLGHEVRKAAYALGNLLPGGRRKGGFIPTLPSNGSNNDSMMYSYPPPEADPCHVPQSASCKAIDPTLRKLDGMHIPAKLLQRARGVAIVTSAKGGLGFAGFEFGTGLVVARRRGPDGEPGDPDDWTAPSAIGIASIAWGALVGAQVSDHVFLLMTEDAVRLFASEGGKSIQLGADIGVAVGPLGRSAEADFGATSGLSRGLDGGYGGSRSGGIAMAPVYTYSLSKGLYAGVSLDGRVLVTRDRVNEKFYGRAVTAHELLSGSVATPPAAQPLYDALKRCRVYGGGGGASTWGEGSVGGPPFSMGSGGVADGYGVDGATNGDRGGFMERLSHTTGAGLPVGSAGSRYSSPNPYNLSGRGGYD